MRTLAAALAGLFLSACGEGRRVAYDDLGYEKNKFTLDGELFSGIAIHKYEDGTIKAEYHIRDGVYHGVAKEFYEDGTPSAETGYRDGLRQGDNTYWNKDGSVMKRQVWQDGKLIREE